LWSDNLSDVPSDRFSQSEGDYGNDNMIDDSDFGPTLAGKKIKIVYTFSSKSENRSGYNEAVILVS
jgi:hypothetical protein